MANTLFLRLEGPMQSWGERARWNIRDSAPEPTKSGVVGLLGCALGWNEDESLHSLSQRIRIGVRCDRPGSLLVDYHTIVDGVMSAEGKVKINQGTKEPETVVSYRSYLCDASFLVAVQSDPTTITQLAEAVQSPVWTIFLGRKSCPPSRPPFVATGDFPSLIEALQSLPIELTNQRINKPLPATVKVRVALECQPSEGTMRRDEMNALSKRTYLPRYSRDMELPVAVQNSIQEEL